MSQRAPLPHVRSYSNSGHSADGLAWSLSANSGLLHRSKQPLYSITASARASNCGSTVSPSVSAVFRLITSCK